ncbi:MAG: extensin family protein [Methylobacteriaceae bacterium]|nr:extensin family protein [Methylobacteriaceae bacterium]
MARRVLPYVAAAFLAGLAGCSVFERPQRPAWRGQAENACLAEKRIRVSAYLQPAREIDGPGICGMDHPFKVAALGDGAVAFSAPVTLACPVISELDRWVSEVVQPAAQARFGHGVVGLERVGGYACRGMNNQRGARLSEHSFGNAFDIAGFRLADGRVVSIAKGWKSEDAQEQAFLRESLAGACEIFTTVLGPGADAFHYDHFHLDLARHGATSTGPRRICKPRPEPQLAPGPGRKLDDLPDPPEIEDEIDVASSGRGMRTLAIAAPPAPPLRPATIAPPSLLSAGRPTPPVAIGAPTRLGPRPLAGPHPYGGLGRGPAADEAVDVTSSIRKRR